MAEQKDPDDGGKKLDVIVESELDPNVLISHNWSVQYNLLLEIDAHCFYRELVFVKTALHTGHVGAFTSTIRVRRPSVREWLASKKYGRFTWSLHVKIVCGGRVNRQSGDNPLLTFDCLIQLRTILRNIYITSMLTPGQQNGIRRIRISQMLWEMWLLFLWRNKMTPRPKTRRLGNCPLIAHKNVCTGEIYINCNSKFVWDFQLKFIDFHAWPKCTTLFVFLICTPHNALKFHSSDISWFQRSTQLCSIARIWGVLHIDLHAVFAVFAFEISVVWHAQKSLHSVLVAGCLQKPRIDHAFPI